MKLLLAAVAGLSLIVGAGARANIIFSDKDTGGIGEVNILFDQAASGSPIFGQIDHSGVDVGFSSLTGQTLHTEGQGQADIEALPNPGLTEMTSINMIAQSGTAWEDVIINLDDAGNPCGGGGNTCGTAHITAIDNFGNAFHDDVLKDGNNFITAIASNGEFITSIQVVELAGETNPLFGWTSFKQPRVSGACILSGASCTPVEMPEPTTLAILASGLLGFGFGWLRHRWRR